MGHHTAIMSTESHEQVVCKALEFQRGSDQCIDEFQAMIFQQNSLNEVGKDLQHQFWRFNNFFILIGSGCNVRGFCNGIHSDKMYDGHGHKFQLLAETKISKLIH